MPAWWVMLDAAEAFGFKPWEQGGGSPVLWFERYAFRRDHLIREAEAERKASGKHR